MLRKFVEDKELDLTKQNDLLGTKCYADELVSTIENVPQGHSYSIGVYGGWGTGKSTILRTAKTKLEINPKRKVKVVVYDAWKYVNDSFRRTFLMQLQNELNLKETPETERFYKNVTEEIEPKIMVRQRGLLITIAVLAIIWVGIGVLDATGVIQSSMTWAALISFASLVIALFNGVFYDLKVSQTRNVLFAPEQFEECFRQIVKQVLRKTEWYKKIYHSVGDFISPSDSVIHDLDKLVIVVDNLDRCSNDVAYTLLTDIKTFLSCENYDVIFVVPVDDIALRKHLFSHKGDEIQRDTEEFLRKFFNVIIRIRAHQPEDMLHYVHELSKVHGLNLNSNTLALIAKEFAKNPRRIVQLVNNITVEQALYDDSFAIKNETLIAAILVLREEYPDMVNKIKDDISLVQKYYELSEDKLKDKIGSTLYGNVEFVSYMRMAKQTFINADGADLLRILTNTAHALDKLTEEIKKAISSYDYKSVLSAIRTDDSIRQDVFLYLKKEAENARSYDAIDQIQNIIDFIAVINSQMSLHWGELHTFNEIVAGFYKDTLKKSTNCQEIVLLAKQMSNYGLYELKTDLMNFVKDPVNKTLGTYQDHFKHVLKCFDTVADCQNLRECAEDEFFDDFSVLDYEFSDNQRRYLLTDSYVAKWIDSISSLDNIKARDNLVWCCENLEGIDVNVLDGFFKKVKVIYGNPTSVDVKRNLVVIGFVTPIMLLLKVGQYEHLENLYREVMKQREVVDVYGRRTSNTDSLVSKVDESNAEMIAEFCFEAYRLISKKSVAASHIAKLRQKSETPIKVKLLCMLHDGEDLSDFIETIQGFTAGDEDIFELMPVLFEKNNVGESLVTDKVKKEKLTLALGYLQFEAAVDFIVKVTKDEGVKKLFLSLLPISDYDYLNNLPPALLSIIVTIYSEDNKDEFKSNNAFLKVVLQNGNSSQMKLVKQALLVRLAEKNDVQGVKEILPSCKLTDSEKRKFAELLASEESDDGDETE